MFNFLKLFSQYFGGLGITEEITPNPGQWIHENSVHGTTYRRTENKKVAQLYSIV